MEAFNKKSGEEEDEAQLVIDKSEEEKCPSHQLVIAKSEEEKCTSHQLVVGKSEEEFKCHQLVIDRPEEEKCPSYQLVVGKSEEELKSHQLVIDESKDGEVEAQLVIDEQNETELIIRDEDLSESGIVVSNNDLSSSLSDNLEDSQNYEENQWRLETIPNEMFLHICSFIDAGFLIRTLSLVCRQFYQVLSNQKTWKIRQEKRWAQNGKYPPVPVDEDEFCWSRACVKREEQIKLWSVDGLNLQDVELRAHIACVDSVHLFNSGKFLASGSRDRSLIIWDVEKCFENPSLNVSNGREVRVAKEDGKIEVKSQAHDGWVWAVTSNPSYLLSASWDNTVKAWDRNNAFQLVTQFPTKVACLSIAATENMIGCGTFDSQVHLYDPRSSFSLITSYKLHRKPVLALGMDEKHVITCGEDGKIIFYDIRASKIHKIIKLPTKSYPTCLSFRREDPANLFYVGDKSGDLHLVDYHNLTLLKSYSIGHSRAVQGVFHSLGSVFTCSRDGTFKVFEPSLNLNQLASFHLQAELPGVHSLHNIVAVADGEGFIRLYSPHKDF